VKKERRRIVRPENDTENVCFAVLSITNYICLYCFAAYILLCVGLVVCFITGRPARSAAMPVLFLLSGPKMGFFRPAGATRCPDKREIWHGGADPPCQISCLSRQKCGNTAPKTVKI